MRESLSPIPSVVPPLAHLLPAAVVVVAATLGLFYAQQTFLPLSTTQFIGGVAGIGVLSALLFGPSRLALTVLFIYALVAHQFRSHIILPFGGVEWHPREILLLLVFAHGAIKVWQRRYSIHWTPLHLCMLLYCAIFAYAAWRGLWLGNDPYAIIAELRAPLFLGAFWVFAGCIRKPRELHYYGILALGVVTVLALMTVALFAYASLAGPWPNTQNAFGEFVPRTAFGLMLQSVRPSGHAYFEAGLVLCAGMFCCPREAWVRRFFYLGLGALFSVAIVAGMMRTAFISVAVGMIFLAWLNLPRAGKGLAAGLGLGVLAIAAFAVIASGSARSILAGDLSANARLAEYGGALNAMEAHPFFGAGLGASFEGLGLAAKSSGGSAIPIQYDSLHNTWLYIAWKAGFIGLGLAALAMTGLLLYSNHIVSRLVTMNQRCFGRSLQAILIGQLAASCTMPRFTYANGALFLAIWTTALVLLDRLGGESKAIAPAETVTVNYPEGEELASPIEEAKSRRDVPNVSPTLEQL